MRIALIDNGSLEPAAHLNLRRAAAAIAGLAQADVAAVSWKHSDRIAPAALEGTPAPTVGAWVREQVGRGERHFLFLPFFISPQGAIGSALANDLAALRDQGLDFTWAFAPGLAQTGVLPVIVAERIAEAARAAGLRQPAVIVVDHGGPSPRSAALRDEVAAAVGPRLGAGFGVPVAASMEAPAGAAYRFNEPLLADALARLPATARDVVIAPLFLSPGRHAGPAGDLAQIAAAARSRRPDLRIAFTELVGTHPLALATLAGNLRTTLNPSLHA